MEKNYMIVRQKPNIPHDILIKFYKGEKTVINEKGINELLDMDME